MKCPIRTARIFFILSVFLCLHTMSAGNDITTPTRESWPVRNTHAFRAGEKWEYDVSWLGIKAGMVSLKIKGFDEIDGEPAMQAVVKAYSSKFFSTFFKVEDRLESLMHRDLFYSLKFNKDIREGNYRRKRETIYDQKKGLADYHGKRMEILPQARDPVACLVYILALDLEKSRNICLNSHSDGKNYPIDIIVQGVERVTVPAGTFDAFRVEPVPSFDSRLFEREKSRLSLWISAGENPVPVRIEAKVKIGAIQAELLRYERGKESEE